MSLPSESIPVRHVYLPDSHNGGATCLICGYDEAFGGLHIPLGPPKPDNGEWKPGDVLRNPVTGGIFAARQRFENLEFLELYPTHVQDHAPAGAELLVRDGKAVCRCLGCSP